MNHSFNSIKIIIQLIFSHMERPAKGDTIDWVVRKALEKTEKRWNTKLFGPFCEGCFVEAAFYVGDCDDENDLKLLKNAAHNPKWGYTN